MATAAAQHPGGRREVAGVLAHEINNFLLVVLGNLECALRDLALWQARGAEPASPPAAAASSGRQSLPHRRRASWRPTDPSAAGENSPGQSAGPDAASIEVIRHRLREAQMAAERIHEMVRDLRSLSQGEPRLGATNVARLLELTLSLLGSRVPAHVRIVRDYSELPLALADEGSLLRVFFNLVLNAVQAISGDLSAGEVCIATRVAAGRVVVEVSDNGCGIEPEDLPRIFEPFFTTKGVEAGRGLGLFICREIVAACGGTITAESRRGAGTTMRVTLLRFETTPAPESDTGA
jgi:signal transduction histidine kinase